MSILSKYMSILSVHSMHPSLTIPFTSNIQSCSLLVQWPDCSPGIEVSVKVNNEKVTCHLQVDWMIMKVNRLPWKQILNSLFMIG